MPESRDPFQELGLTPAFALPELEHQFLTRQTQEHPDLLRGDASQKQEAEARFARIVWAYEELKDPLKRAQYLFQRAGLWPIPQDPQVLQELMEVEEQFLEGHLSKDHIQLLSRDALRGLGMAFENKAFGEAATYYLRWGLLRRLERQELKC